jgi:protein SCO1/2
MNERARVRSFLPLLALIAAACSPAGGRSRRWPAPGSAGRSPSPTRAGRASTAAAWRANTGWSISATPSARTFVPVDLQQIGLALKRFEADDPARAARLQPLFITTDPARDTPAVLKEYVAAFHPRLIGLTGSAEEIAAVSKAYGVWSARQETQGSSDYLVNHSRMAVLFGPKGEPMAILPHQEGADAILPS